MQLAIPLVQGEPLFRQVYRGVRHAILSGALHAKDRLPSTRDLAEQLGISRTVVLLAYDQLLADTIKELPGVQIVLGEPFLLPVGKHKEPYAVEFAELRKRQAVVAQLAEKYHLPLIHYQEIFDRACRKAPAEYWLWDGVHPSYAGHALMAEEWARIVRKSLPKP